MKHKLLKVTILACYIAYAFTFHALASLAETAILRHYGAFLFVFYTACQGNTSIKFSPLMAAFSEKLASADLVCSCASCIVQTSAALCVL